MSQADRRRDFLKTAATTAASLAAGAFLANNADAQDPIRKIPTQKIQAVPLNQRAVLPDGRQLTREQILETLNLNPNTPPEAWLTVVGCGSNASGLKPGDAKILIDKGLIQRNLLTPIQLEQIRQIRPNR